MELFNRKEHWENIYTTKALETVSWYQPDPYTSLTFIRDSGLSKTAAIIDIGGGDSFLTDHLLEAGYENITVLDISQAAIERAKARLKENATKVNGSLPMLRIFNRKRNTIYGTTGRPFTSSQSRGTSNAISRPLTMPLLTKASWSSGPSRNQAPKNAAVSKSNNTQQQL